MKNIWLEGIMGLVVGDALGVPVQFLSRNELRSRKEGPVVGMESEGVFHLPAGSWSDDSSLSLATLCSILEQGGIDLDDIMKRFVSWYIDGEYTPYGFSYDQGHTCRVAIENFSQHADAKTCGVQGEYANGNGALMRIMPACLYYYEREKKGNVTMDEIVEGIHLVSGLTHNHLRSQICCGFYYFCVKSIIDGTREGSDEKSLQELLQQGIEEARKYYGQNEGNIQEMNYLRRLFDLDAFKAVDEADIKSSGYVIDTIEAAIWCLINTGRFDECLLKVVNLGLDTDSVAAVAGGLAALYYGYEDIPDKWLEVIKKREWIEELCAVTSV